MAVSFSSAFKPFRSHRSGSWRENVRAGGRRLFAIVGLVMGLTACVQITGNSVSVAERQGGPASGGGQGGAGFTVNLAACAAVAGSYERACVVDPRDLSQSSSVVTLLWIGSDCKALLSSRSYPGSLTCNSTASRERKEYFDLSGDIRGPTMVAARFSKIEETTLTSGEAANANAQNRYGYTDWSAGTVKDITGRTDPGGGSPAFSNGAILYTWMEYSTSSGTATFYINTETNSSSSPGGISQSVARVASTTYVWKVMGGGAGGGGGGGGGGGCSGSAQVGTISANMSPNSVYLTQTQPLGQSFSLSAAIQLKYLTLYITQADGGASRTLGAQLYAFTSNPGVPSSVTSPVNLGPLIGSATANLTTSESGVWKTFPLNSPLTLNAGNYWVQFNTNGGAIRVSTVPSANGQIASGNGFSAMSGFWNAITTSPGDDLSVQFFQCQ